MARTNRFKICLLLLLLTAIASPAQAKGKMKLLIWWESLDPRIAKKLRDAGYDLDVTYYKSNDIALSRLTTKSADYDVTVVSSLTLPKLLEFGKIESLERVQKTKVAQYEEFLRVRALPCVPWGWSPTIFGYDSRKKIAPPTSLEALAALKKAGHRIAILDDPFEVSARLILDSSGVCKKEVDPKDIFDTFPLCSEKGPPLPTLALSPDDFRSSVEDVYKDGNVAASYGWHGEIAAKVAEAPWIRFAVAAENPVIGADFVCLPKKANESKASLAKRIDFVEKLTDRESTRWSMEMTQYFSAYKDDERGLQEPVRDLRRKVLGLIKKSKAVFLKLPNASEHKFVNEWWQKLRYGNN